MRTTLTRHQYNKRLAVIESALFAAASERDAILAHLEGDAENGPHPVDETTGDHLNALHDRIYDLEQERRHLEFEWDTRRWSAQEWREWDLITSNID